MNKAKPDPTEKYYDWLDGSPGVEEIARCINETTPRTHAAIKYLIDQGYIESNQVFFYLSHEGIIYKERERECRRAVLLENLWFPIIASVASGVLLDEAIRFLIKLIKSF